ncbi:MAG: hypothetical protein ACKOZU_00720, partial [Planctomycetaceae bacterium]
MTGFSAGSADDGATRPDRAILDHLPDGIALVNAAGVVHWSNDRLTAWCGSCAAEGRDLFAVLG